LYLKKFQNQKSEAEGQKSDISEEAVDHRWEFESR